MTKAARLSVSRSTRVSSAERKARDSAGAVGDMMNDKRHAAARATTRRFTTWIQSVKHKNLSIFAKAVKNGLRDAAVDRSAGHPFPSCHRRTVFPRRHLRGKSADRAGRGRSQRKKQTDSGE